jgi:hypothetical protein
VPLIFGFAPRDGATGAALVMGGARLGSDALAMGLALRALPLRYPLAFAGRVALATAAMTAVIAPLALTVLAPAPQLPVGARAGYLAGNLALAAVGAAVYLGAFRLTGGLDEADRRRIRDLRLPAATWLLRLCG